jgi:heat-inducible transcriptional repressor
MIEVFSLKPGTIKKKRKSERELSVLLGVVDLYIKNPKPVGSNSLRENGFDDLSSATIRNYFAKLESIGFLHQPHTSGGRIPTSRAFKYFAEQAKGQGKLSSSYKRALGRIRNQDSKKIFETLEMSLDILSSLSNAAVFISAPRFEQDAIIDIKLTPIDAHRCLGILITSFGQIHTHTLFLDSRLSHHAIRRIEKHLSALMTTSSKPDPLTQAEADWMKKIYHELMVRFITSYSSGQTDGIYKAGLSRLLESSDFAQPGQMAQALSVFENSKVMQETLMASIRSSSPCVFIGSDLKPKGSSLEHCAVITSPYRINGLAVGAVGLLAPERCDYQTLFALIEAFTDTLGEVLTETSYVHKITWKEPEGTKLYLPKPSPTITHQTPQNNG